MTAKRGVIESFWRNIYDAPRDRPALLLLADQSTAVGRYDRRRGGWFAHLPGLAESFPLQPIKWARVPPIPTH
jgi:hypothetical protein